MAKIFKKSSNAAGLAPGALVHIGERKAEKTKITIIDYDEEKFQEIFDEKLEVLRQRMEDRKSG